MSEDGNLDDFFAKKDKVKKKSNKTRITPDDIGQMLEKKLAKSGKKAGGDKAKNKTSSSYPNSHVLNVKTEDDDEWKEVEKEEEKDYSNLKIQNLNISAKVEIDQDSGETNQSGDDDNQDKKDTAQGPWKPIAQPVVISPPEPSPSQPIAPKEPPKTMDVQVPTDTASPKLPGKYVPPGARQQIATSVPSSTTEPPSSNKVTTSDVPKTSGKYIPPGARQAQAASTAKQQPEPVAAAASTTAKPAGKYVPPFMRQSGATSQQQSSSSSSSTQPSPLTTTTRRKKVAPNVNSVEDFPTLEAATIIEHDSTANEFEKVKGGVKQATNQSNGTRHELSLDNKFSQLKEDLDS